jgi:hypothetical protein
MSFTIYGLRIKGDIEVRYIGQTGKTLDERLYVALAKAKNNSKNHHGIVPDLSRWLLGNEVESVALTTAATRAEARAKEREMVEAFAKLGHRLFNRWLVPTKLRRASRMSGDKVSSIREGNNLRIGDPVFAGNLSHLGEHPKELARGIRPSLSSPMDLEKSSIEGPLGVSFNENGGRFVCRVGHPYALHTRGFGAAKDAANLTSVNGVVTASGTKIS